MHGHQIPEGDEGVQPRDPAVERRQGRAESTAGDGDSVLGAEEGLSVDPETTQSTLTSELRPPPLMTRTERKAFEGALKTILKPRPPKNRGRKKRRKKGR